MATMIDLDRSNLECFGSAQVTYVGPGLYTPTENYTTVTFPVGSGFTVLTVYTPNSAVFYNQETILNDIQRQKNGS